MRLALAFRVGDGDRARLTLGELRVPGGVDDLALHPPDDCFFLRDRVRVHAADEPQVVDDLQQRGERLRVAVVRRRGQEEPVLEVRGQPADQLGLLGVDRVPLLRRGGRHVVRLVEDQQVERALIVGSVVALLALDHLVQQPLGLGAAQPGQRDDRQRVHPERVRRAAVTTPQLVQLRGVDDREVQAELLGHLVLPLHHQPRRADDHDPLRAVPQQQFQRDQASLDRLAQAHVVGEQQVHPGRLDRAGDRLELVLLDDDARTQRGLQRLHVGGRDRGPADRVKEGGQALGRVEASRGDLGE